MKRSMQVEEVQRGEEVFVIDEQGKVGDDSEQEPSAPAGLGPARIDSEGDHEVQQDRAGQED